MTSTPLDLDPAAGAPVPPVFEHYAHGDDDAYLHALVRAGSGARGATPAGEGRSEAQSQAQAQAQAAAVPIPVLGPVTDAHRAVAAVSSLTPQRPAGEPGDVVVVSPAGSGVADIAAALAEAVGGRHLAGADFGGIGAACAGARYVVVVALAGEVGERELAAAQDGLWAACGALSGGHLGLLTGETRADVAWLTAKGLGLPYRRVAGDAALRVWSALESLERTVPGPVVLAEDARISVLRPLLTERRWRDLSIMTHGRDDTAIFHDGVVCAPGPLRLEIGDPDLDRAPACAFTGRCYRPGVGPEQVLQAERILADAVFGNVCMSLRLADGLFPTRYLLPHGFVRGGAAGYVGSPMVVNGSAKLADVFHACGAAGLTLGETVSVMNDHLRHERVDLPSFTLLGLPWARLGESDPAAWDAFAQVRAESGTHWGAARATALALAAQAQTGRSLVLATSPRSSAALAAIPEVPGPAAFDAAAAPDLSARARALGRAMTNLDDVPHLGLRYSRHGNVMTNVRAQVTTLAAGLSRAALAGDVDRLNRRLATVAQSVERAELGLAEALAERGVNAIQTFNDMWGERFEYEEPELSGEDCPYCGRALVRQHATHSVFGRLRRTATICPRCVVVVDADDASPVVAARIACAETWLCDSNQEVTFSFEVGPRHKSPTVAVAVYVSGAEKIGLGPATVELVRLDADGTGRLTAKVAVTPQARVHQEYVRAIVVAEGAVVVVSRPVWVRPGERTVAE